MIRKLLGILVPVLFFASTASAQCPADLILIKAGGVYDFGIDPDGEVNLLQICCQRIDVVPVIDLGCIDATSPPVDPLMGYPMSVTVAPTPGDDAEIRCYSEDADTNLPIEQRISALSCNKGDIDFTAPRSPRLKN